ncbi:MAG: tRNA (adenosine(37)-N6)-threonylcarbamoyltransferase complex ATPase subunit type 1 TsaE [Betaproteobacteria bacterium]|nr:MAG: tRNA (adenosine(37)-N6)-threonylcarbamoyltransferase complex ATPase subunit type 1 TsaE [Betaproteobacteria bacterium]TDI81160.1 MAG: tRNA (adenosine(37)-N6)-threonylcarbamoyltransferase complex ATPase subunit type 1 TsaE [Betaproteobacteria bacterium]
MFLHSSHHNNFDATCHLANESTTLALGAEIATILHPGFIVFLKGNLGAGKTTFARGILRGMGYQGKVKSPTYNLVELYKFSRLYFYHFDFYRFDDPIEWEEAGFREYFNANSICLVEWPEKAGKLLPTADLQIFLNIIETGRDVEIQAGTEAGRQCLKDWQTQKHS